MHYMKPTVKCREDNICLTVPISNSLKQGDSLLPMLLKMLWNMPLGRSK